MALLPDTIPCSFGSLAGIAAPLTGNGWEVQVRAHTDFSTLVRTIPSWTSLQFAKILKDKGSGSIVLNLDDPVLFPKDKYSLNANADLAQGIADWDGQGASVSLVQPGPPGGALPNSLFIVPAGIATNSYAEQAGNPFPVIPGQRYTVRTTMYSASGTVTPVLGMVFTDTYGLVTPVLDASRLLRGGAWRAYGTTVTAPPGAVSGWAAVGVGMSASPAQSVYAQGTAVTYEDLFSTVLPPPFDPAAPVLKVLDLPPGAATVGDYLLSYEHLWQVYRDGQLLFDFTGQTVTVQQVDQSEQRLATITGPGTAATLGWARAMPPGFPHIVFKTDAIQDGFAEVDANGNPALDTNIWNASSPLDHITLSPPGTCQLTATPGGTTLGAVPYDITGSSISAQINRPGRLDSTNAALDGSQLTEFIIQGPAPNDFALIGLTSTQFYAQVSTQTLVVPGPLGGPTAVVQQKDLGKYASSADLYWRISEDNGRFAFWTSADGQNWVLRWQPAYSWDASVITVKFVAQYDVDQTVAVGITNVNGDIVTPTSAGNIFLLTPIMGVWKKLFDAAQGRGTIPFVTTRLTSATDSFGNRWADAMSVQIQNGSDLFSLLQTHAGIVNADWIMQPGFVLQVGLPQQTSTGGIGLGSDLVSKVILRESKEEMSRQYVRARDQVANSFGAVNSDGTVVSGSDPVSISRYGQREGWVTTAQAVNAQSMKIVLDASVAEGKDEILSETISVLPDYPRSTPLLDYDVGDWIGRERPGVGYPYIEAIRVLGISFSVDATGSATSELTVSTYRQYLEQQLTYLVNKFGGQFVNALGTTPVTSIGTTSTVPKVIAPTLGGLADVIVGTDDQDPLVFNGFAGVWQNASNTTPSGSPIGVAVGPSGGSKASLQPGSGQTLSVDGGASWTFLSAFQAASAASSETAPAVAVPLVIHQGAANEQLAFLLMSGMSSGNSAFALLLQADSADNTVVGHARIGHVDPGTGVTWAFTTIQVF